MPTPWMAPKTATPAKHTIDSQNSQRSILNSRLRSLISNRPIADEMTTAANAAVGTCLRRSGANNRSRATMSAPTTPVSWVLEPAASATGVRDELLLIGKP